MHIDPKTEILTDHRFLPSPNYDERPLGILIDMIVIHNISLPPGQFGGPYIDQFFSNNLDLSVHAYFNEIAHLKVSSHCLIDRTGAITQYVPFKFRAFHAGQSYFQGREKCNDFSIGIELEGADEVPYASEQYDCLTDLIIALQNKYPAITMDRIVGHSTIAPGRKTDPGEAFDWILLKKLLQLKQRT